MKQSDKIIIGLTIICCIIMLICVFTSSGVEENRECGTVEVVENNEDVGVEEKSYSIVIKNSKELEQELYKIYGIEFVVYEEEKVNDVDFSTYTYYYVHPKNNSNLRFKIKDNEINKSVYYFSLACMDLNDYLENGKRTYIKEIDWWEEIPPIKGLTVLPVVYDCDDVYPNEYQGHAGYPWTRRHLHNPEHLCRCDQGTEEGGICWIGLLLPECTNKPTSIRIYAS